MEEDLSTGLSIPASCWWRDDLDARINASSDIKWSFPEIIKGSDLLQFLVEPGSKEQSEARAAAIRSYMAAQYADDEQVKFKQVGLQNELLELFVDLPAGSAYPRQHEPQRWLEQELSAGDGYYYENAIVEAGGHISTYVQRRTFALAAASLLKHPLDTSSTRIVMEGAPGQGKSTITQYICQVNRVRFLEKPTLSSIPPEHLKGPLRLPFRIDLRDYASWLQGRNPFSADSSAIPTNAQPGLESFIAAQVNHVSGGHEFNVTDFSAVTRSSHVLIVLDGFDEVADISIRKKTVEEISRASARIHANAKSAQIVVTSRPSAFANSPGFPEAEWQHVELQSMPASQINAYAKKWMAARQLSTRERTEFEKLLREKLEQPHMRDLARNPMQLTILLALIHQRGLSLPDKRTALYDSYMDLFFSREAEKSAVVREHRDLLIDIHQYLAWRLQAAAEKGSSSGAISEPDLRALLTKYLKEEGHETNLVQDLFTGMVERVVALVSRVEGTFEFEVQPLREYFADRYLYETAPYSPPGAEKKGTTPERFAALAGNFYWLNVARFFSGCFNRGELAALADSLEELNNDDEMGLVEHPRLLALMLLGDWVFSQQPLAVQRVVAALFKQPGFKILISSERERSPNSKFALPDKCGRAQLLDIAYTAIQKPNNSEERRAYLGIILENSSSVERRELWRKRRTHIPDKLWLEQGLELLVIQASPLSELATLYSEFGPSILDTLMRAGRVDLIYQEEVLFKKALESIAAGAGSTFSGRRNRRLSSIEKLGLFLQPQTYRTLLDRNDVGHYQSIQRRLRSTELDVEDPAIGPKVAPLAEQTRVAVDKIDLLFKRSDVDWSSSLEPWIELLTILTADVGSGWAAARIAILSAGIKSTTILGAWTDNKWQIDSGLCDRLRFARLKSGNIKWWRDELNLLRGQGELAKRIAIVTFLVWATPKTIEGLVKEISTLTDELSAPVWKELYANITDIMETVSAGRRADSSAIHVMSKHMSERVALSMTKRSSMRVNRTVYINHFQRYSGTDPEILGFIMMSAIHELSETPDWNPMLKIIRNAYRGGATPSIFYHNLAHMPKAVAVDVCQSAQDYPESIVRIAQRILAADIGARAKKISDVAETEGWFVTN